MGIAESFARRYLSVAFRFGETERRRQLVHPPNQPAPRFLMRFSK
jgi:hypothetical protein